LLVEYDQRRKEEADALGIRVSILDREVAKRCPKEADGSADADGLDEIEPWPGEVAGGQLVTRLYLKGGLTTKADNDPARQHLGKISGTIGLISSHCCAP
jgi:hypothetical protein